MAFVKSYHFLLSITTGRFPKDFLPKNSTRINPSKLRVQLIVTLISRYVLEIRLLFVRSTGITFPSPSLEKYDTFVHVCVCVCVHVIIKFETRNERGLVVTHVCLCIV